ncbi:TIR-like protein FxsC [Actinoplanes sp. NPDC051494]|uniref:TIR-like protein FxsC n=1 Tax=Actinoplanes sp. NPDC051494 TaxID=3363907 RepID=UPI0037AF1820
MRFFISYVHDSGEDDRHVDTFYRDLHHDVLMFAGQRSHDTAGFCDTTLSLGQRWSPSLIDALSTAQVFVPLLSPAYFASPACGKEWQIFTSRLARSGRLHGAESSIVPLLWVPMKVPAVAEPYQYREAAFGPGYERAKLRALIRETRNRDEYHAFVQLLASRIVDLSDGDPVVVSSDRPAFDTVRSAFETPALVTAPAAPPVRRRVPRPAVNRDERPILNPNLLPEDPR